MLELKRDVTMQDNRPNAGHRTLMVLISLKNIENKEELFKIMNIANWAPNAKHVGIYAKLLDLMYIQGKKGTEIQKELGLDHSTCKHYITTLYNKLFYYFNYRSSFKWIPRGRCTDKVRKDVVSRLRDYIEDNNVEFDYLIELCLNKIDASEKEDVLLLEGEYNDNLVITRQEAKHLLDILNSIRLNSVQDVLGELMDRVIAKNDPVSGSTITELTQMRIRSDNHCIMGDPYNNPRSRADFIRDEVDIFMSESRTSKLGGSITDVLNALYIPSENIYVVQTYNSDIEFRLIENDLYVFIFIVKTMLSVVESLILPETLDEYRIQHLVGRSSNILKKRQEKMK